MIGLKPLTDGDKIFLLSTFASALAFLVIRGRWRR